MVDQNCAYCVEGELLAKFGIKICELENSKVYLFEHPFIQFSFNHLLKSPLSILGHQKYCR